MEEASSDALSLLRRSIAINSLPLATRTAEGSTFTNLNIPFAEASFLIFNVPQNLNGPEHTVVALTQPTRFVSPAAGNVPLDLRSVFFCWLHKDSGIGEYISATQAANDALKAFGKSERVTNLVFAEKLDLVTWLAGEIGEEESEHIRSLGTTKKLHDGVRDVADDIQKEHDVEMQDAGVVEEAARRKEGDRLREIYSMERKTGDHNTALRGVKTQDYSDIRTKFAVLFFGRARPPAAPVSIPSAMSTGNLSVIRPSVKSQSGRRPEPIILLSPSASSLLRLPNIKSFLEDGRYVEPESGTSANILHLMRTLPAISSKALRFIIVDDPSSFRPDYWERLVAVFTTGQTWQFKHYKWSKPADLFAHALGIYVGHKGEVIPDAIRGWGRGVLSVQIDQGPNRWRDREVVEDIWRGIEGHMKARGWGKDMR